MVATSRHNGGGRVERLKRRDRRVGLAAELPEEWVEAVRSAKVPEEFGHLMPSSSDRLWRFLNPSPV